MKSLIRIVVFLLLAGCDDGWDCTLAEGDKTLSEIRSEITVRHIRLFDDINLVWHDAEIQRIELETGENLIEGIFFDFQSDSLLEITNDNSCLFVRSPRNVTVHVYSRDIRLIEKVGFGEVITEGNIQREGSVEIVTLGSGNVNVGFEGTSDLFITMRSLSNITVRGQVGILHAFVDRRNDGKVEARDLLVDHINIVHSGSNDMMLSPSLSLRGDLNSFGNILLYREPETIEVTINGSGRIIQKF